MQAVTDQHDPAASACEPRSSAEQLAHELAVTRMDMHAHSAASNGPALAALGLIGCPESYSEPERVYDQAMARGMDLVTITDHDTIAGALALHERGFQRFVIGEEVTVFFPEDRCKLHVLVWGLSPAQHEEMHALGLRGDVYAFAHWLAEQHLAHALAHPLYAQNGRLGVAHLEKCALLFKGFETLNGAHSGHHRVAVEAFLAALTPARVQALVERHGIRPLWPRIWDKGRTGGSDDHALLNVGRTWTQVRAPSGRKLDDPREFLRLVLGARSVPRGAAGHSALLAHQLTTVGAQFWARRFPPPRGAVGRHVRAGLLRFAGVEEAGPGRAALALDVLRRRVLRRRRTPPLARALSRYLGPALDRHVELKDRLDPARWLNGAPLADHERMARFADDLIESLTRELAAGLLGRRAGGGGRRRAWFGAAPRLARADAGASLASLGALAAAQLPYLVSLFHQNKERALLERVAHEAAAAGSGASALERPMRVSLITDTLGDVNGVCRFIRNVAERARATGRDLEVMTSTRMPVPPGDNIVNFEPVLARTMPRYENLECVLPPVLRMLRHLDARQPDVLHISTPGPVGLVGFLAARMLRVPVLGVYHTDFPAYVDHLFDDPAFTALTARYMRVFYAPFRAVFTRSRDYADSLVRLGLPRQRVVPLLPGVDVDTFHPRHKDTSIWSRFAGVSAGSVKVLYCGRVSVEKNMPLLAGVWRRVHAACRSRGLQAELIVVGDGPYRAKMQRDLKGLSAHFLGFRHGAELSALYASSDLFVFPSATDTLGQVVMESQASGLPVIVSDQGGPKEVVAEGTTGHVLPATDADRWVDAIFGLVDDHSRRRAMGAAAHEAMQHHSIAGSFEHFWQVHERLWREHLAGLGVTPRATPAPRAPSAPHAPPAPDRRVHAESAG